MKKRLHRRAFLRGAAGALISLPLLESMGCSTPSGSPTAATNRRESAGEARIQRFIGALVPNGVVARDWFPTVREDGGFDLNRTMAPFEPHKDDLLIFRGVHNQAVHLSPATNHWQGTFSMLTGRPIIGGNSGPYFGAGISLDQLIAEHVGAQSPRRSLELSTEGASLASISWQGSRLQRLPQTRPLRVFTGLFGEPGADPEVIARRLVRRQSVLDRVADDLSSLTPRVSGEDRIRIEAHFDAIRDVENRLSFANQCGTPDYAFGEPSAEHWYRSMIDLLVLAFSCDSTRVATMVFRHAGGGRSYFPWLEGHRSEAEAANPGERNALYNQFEHHEMSHRDVPNGEKLHDILSWFGRQTAYLLDRLKATPEGDGSLFDSVVYLQGSDIGEGNHTVNNIPFVMAGNAYGAFRTGRFMDYAGQGESHNRLLISIMNAFGIPGDVFGDPRVCRGGALDLA